MVSVVALLMLVVLASLAVAFATSTSLNMHQSHNYCGVAQARLAAEGGLEYMLHVLGRLKLPPNTTPQNFVDNCFTALTACLSPASFSGESISMAGIGIHVPDITLPHGSFSADIGYVDVGGSSVCRVIVTGRDGAISRRVAVDLSVVPRRSPFFDYGVASRGRVSITGSGTLTGLNSPSQATVLSMRSAAPAIQVGGSAVIGGELFMTGDTTDYIQFGQGNGNGGGGGGFSVAGSGDPNTILTDHAHFGVADPDFPELNLDPLIALATGDVIDSGTSLNGSGLVFNNVRVVAGTNPTFSNTTIINGLLYVESPNIVTFCGGATVNGIIVTEEDPTQDPALCTVDFRGHTSVPGVAALDGNDPRFTEIKQYVGSAILAPGFNLIFRGTSGTVNGLIAADGLDFRGNSSIAGELNGNILGLKDTELSIQGSTSIKLNPLSSGTNPAGFVHYVRISPIAGSYAEPIGN